MHTSTTPFTVLLTAFQLLLHLVSGQDDIVVGTPVGGRLSDTQGLIGCFVNTLAIRANLAGSSDFRTMVARTRQCMLDALAHGDVPFEQIVAGLKVDRVVGRNPVFRVLFSVYDESRPLVLDGLEVTVLPVSLHTAKVDLQLLIQKTDSGFRGTLEFDCDLIDEERATQLANQYVALVAAAAVDPDTPTKAL